MAARPIAIARAGKVGQASFRTPPALKKRTVPVVRLPRDAGKRAQFFKDRPFHFFTPTTHPSPQDQLIPQSRLAAFFNIYRAWDFFDYEFVTPHQVKVQFKIEKPSLQVLNSLCPGWSEGADGSYLFTPNVQAKYFGKRLRQLDEFLANQIDSQKQGANPFGNFKIYEVSLDSVQDHPVVQQLVQFADDPHAALATLDGPTILHLDAGKEATRVFSVLLHSNEPSSLRAMLKFLQQPLEDVEANVVFVVHNVWAAQASQFRRRYIEGAQFDRNRNWISGKKPTEKDYVKWDDSYVNQLFQYLESLGNVEAILDMHNTSGQTDPFSLVASMANDTLNIDLSKRLVSHFADYFFHIKVFDAMISASRYIAPSMAVEVGKKGTHKADVEAMRILWKFLSMSSSGLLQYQTVPRQYDIEATFKLRDLKVQLAIAASINDSFPKGVLALRHDIEDFNMKGLKKGEWIALWNPVNPNDPLPFRVTTRDKDVSDQYFELRDGVLYLKQDIVPLMATLDLVNIVQSGGDALYVAKVVQALAD